VAEEPAVAEEIAKSIAVLPFVNMSDDAGNEYFSDGISEEILNALAKVKDLQVAGRTSSFAFKDQNQDLHMIGEALGVDHILEGSVRKAGNTVRITAQLIRVDNGFHLWSESYDRELTDVFAIQDEIANAILEQLKAQLAGGEVQSIVATKTDTEAYELYLLAKQRMYERTGPTIEAAAELLDRAITLDPAYAPAYAQRGIATLLLADSGGAYGNIPEKLALSQARLYLDKALELDPGLAEGWAGMGLLYDQDDTPGTDYKAIEMLEKALAINPGLIDASNWLHNSLVAIGKPAEAREVVLGMIERDPLYRPGIRNAVNKFIDFGEQDKAWALLERVRPLIPNDAVILGSEAAILMSEGGLAEGLERAEATVALQPSNSVARNTVRFGLLDSGQWGRLADMDEGWQPILALVYLGRTEEASIRAHRRAEEEFDVPTLFAFLNLDGRSDELVRYLEERWTSLEALQRDFPPYSGLGYFMMIEVALAYSRNGNLERFDEAMKRIHDVHEDLKSQGVNNFNFLTYESAYQALAGNLDTSLDYLDRAVTMGMVTHPRISIAFPALQRLEGDSRFEAIQARMVEHLNSERAKMGLEPLTT
jgi:TolB-like protein